MNALKGKYEHEYGNNNAKGVRHTGSEIICNKDLHIEAVVNNPFGTFSKVHKIDYYSYNISEKYYRTLRRYSPF